MEYVKTIEPGKYYFTARMVVLKPVYMWFRAVKYVPFGVEGVVVRQSGDVWEVVPITVPMISMRWVDSDEERFREATITAQEYTDNLGQSLITDPAKLLPEITKTTTDMVRCNVDIIKLIISGIVSTYNEDIWVEDENLDEGGSYQNIVKTYKNPKIVVDFKAMVDIDLFTGGTYSDGENLFHAIDKNHIINEQRNIDSFSVPKSLILISAPAPG